MDHRDSRGPLRLCFFLHALFVVRELWGVVSCVCDDVMMRCCMMCGGNSGIELLFLYYSMFHPLPSLIYILTSLPVY